MESLWDTLPDDVQRLIMHEAQVMHGQSVRASKRAEVDAQKARVRDLQKSMTLYAKEYVHKLINVISRLPYVAHNYRQGDRVIMTPAKQVLSVAKHQTTLHQLQTIKQQHLDARDELLQLLALLKSKGRPMDAFPYPHMHDSLAKQNAWRMRDVFLTA